MEAKPRDSGKGPVISGKTSFFSSKFNVFGSVVEFDCIVLMDTVISFRSAIFHLKTVGCSK